MGDPRKRFFAAFMTIVISSAALIAGSQPASAATTTLSALFAELSFQPEATQTYDRALFQHWIDADANGCDTRQEVLIAESLVPVTKGSGCTVTAGQWYSWYDGATWTNPSDIDIDHLVALQEAWQSGAWNWTAEQRKAYANDLGYLHSLEGVTDSASPREHRTRLHGCRPWSNAATRLTGSL